VSQRILIENKVTGRTRDPFLVKPDAPYQANRYALATCQRIFFTVIGYTPDGTGNLIEQTRSIRIRKLDNIERTAVDVCVVIPHGLPRPSETKRPAGEVMSGARNNGVPPSCVDPG
jgi:hypothetical protein